MGEFNESSPAPMLQRPPTGNLPFREDCWSEEATSTLVDVWGRRYLELNRGNLRQKDWQEVADAVNARHGHTKKTRRTDIQCKNRIDTLKKKYKVEKAKIAASNGTLTSSWPFFTRLEALIGSNLKNQPQKGLPLMNSFSQSPFSLPSPPMGIPLYNKKQQLLPLAQPPLAVEPVMLPQKRQFSALDDSYFRKNYSAVAAAAAAAAAEENLDEDEKGDGGSEDEEEEVEEREEGTEEEEEEEEGMRTLAKAIARFGEIYERVENIKQRQMVELEKQRMQFAKDLELQRMQLFMDTQVQLEKFKQAKRSGSDDVYS